MKEVVTGEPAEPKQIILAPAESPGHTRQPELELPQPHSNGTVEQQRLDLDVPADASPEVEILFHEMPTTYQFERLKSALAANPGPSHVTFKTPQGDVDTEWTVNNSEAFRAQVAVFLPRAQITIPPAAIDTSTLLAGIKL